MSDLNVTRIGVTTYATPLGGLNEPGLVDQLRTAIDECISRGELYLVVDLERCPLLSSRALDLLLDARDRLEALGGELRLSKPNQVCTDALRVTQVLDQIEVVGQSPDSFRPARSEPARQRIGELLVQRGLATPERVEEVLELQAQTGRRMVELMVEKAWVAEKDLLQALSDQLGIPYLWVRPGVWDPEVVARIDTEVCRRLGVLPLLEVRGHLYVATPDPQSIPDLETLEDLTHLPVRPVLACSDDIAKALEELGGEGTDLSEFMGEFSDDLEIVERAELDAAAVDEMAAGGPVVNLVNGIIQRAVRDGASDIHIEPSRRYCRIRLRIDGVLYPIMSPPISIHPALVSRLKVMADLDIAERRLPQDGRIQVRLQGRPIDLRFSSLPGMMGEKVVLRVLDKRQALFDLDQTGLAPHNLATLKSLLGYSHGLILVTGPTGSGKTTTLYAGIRYLDSEARNIVTIEDPVEYQIDSINQNQVHEVVGLGFARMLKHVLRQDPDIIMVGEIRERETAEIAVQAALTGHLVLSTLHTNDSIGALTRMLEMGVEPYLMSSALIGVMAQRLVRLICPSCKTEHVVPAESLEPYGVKQTGEVRLARGRGCSECYDSGFKGRGGIHEILVTDSDLQRLIAMNPTRDQLDAYLSDHGVHTLLDDGIRMSLEKRTSVEEVLRVVRS